MSAKTGKPYSNLLESEVIIRKAQSNDVSKIYDILELEIASNSELSPIKQFLEDGFESSPWFHVLLAEQGGEVVGVAVYHRSYWSWTGRTVRLLALAVRCVARRRGIGSRILRELCRISLEENAQLEWSHPTSNLAATAFFAKFKSHVNMNLDRIRLMRIALDTIDVIPNDDKRSNDEIYVRMARPEDMAELKMTILEIATFQEVSNGPQLDEKDLTEDCFLCSPAWFFALVACRGSSVVGAVMGCRTYRGWARSVYLQSLYVRETARRCGVAVKLMHAFNRLAIEEGAQFVDFHVDPDNAPALKLYERYGVSCIPSDDVDFRIDRKDIKEISNYIIG